MRLRPTKRLSLTAPQLLLLAAAWMAAVLNLRFFRNATAVYPLSAENAGFLISLALVLAGMNVLLLTFVSHQRLLKPLLTALLPLAALLAYFMDSYNVVIDRVMLMNVLQTDAAETTDLLSPRLLVYLLLLGALPALALRYVSLRKTGWRNAVIARAAMLVIPLAIMAGSVFIFGTHYASFIREHKALRQYANPAYPLYAASQLAAGAFDVHGGELETLGLDAQVPDWDGDRELIVLVVGETARADHFSLNGYARDTNPRLAQKNVISLDNVWSCGTSTSVSVPCMFARHETGKFDLDDADDTENALDVLSHAGVRVLWRDNNSSSKGVANRVPHEDFRSPETNPECDIECRDTGMLAGLQDFVNETPEGDILIVLHQMGNHGPAYYKRYPEAFEIFTPVCRSNELDVCTEEEVTNAYDNAILYTDYFLSRVIEFLEGNDAKFETAMMYVSDHGESLGEYGVYLHGMPYKLAPEAQKHVPAIFWFGRNYHDVDLAGLQARAGERYTHANVFHTLIGLMELETETYDAGMDMLPHVTPRANNLAARVRQQ